MSPFPIHASCCIRIVALFILLHGFISSDAQPQNAAMPDNPWQTKKACLYKSRLDVYGQSISGMMVIKADSGGSFRHVFMNETGMKYFDLQIWEDSYRVRQIFEPLNRNMLIKLLVRSYRTMLFTEVRSQKAKICNQSNLTKTASKFGHILFDAQTGKIKEIYTKKFFRKNLRIVYEINDTVPAPVTIEMSYRNIQFNQHFKLINPR